MKNLAFILIVFVLSAEYAHGQKSIKYGSNNGKYVSIFNTKIYYEEYGNGTPLLLLEGGMGSIEDFAACIPTLSRKYRVIAPDMPGQGRSGMADSMSYQLLANYISKFVDVIGVDSCYVMGWSDGGNTALILANNRADKIKKVLVSGANYSLNGYPSILKDTTDFVREINSPQFEIDAKVEIAHYLKLGPGRDWKKMFIDVNKMWKQPTYFPASVLEGINIPVMLVLGDKDAVTLEHGI